MLLTCVDCAATVIRTGTRGRVPRRCEACRTEVARKARRGVRSERPCLGAQCTSTVTGLVDYCSDCSGRRPPRWTKREQRPPTPCANPACSVTIAAPRPTQKWCSTQCRHRVTDASPAARARWARKNAKRRPSPHTASGWRKLRNRVLDEEPECWLCGDEIDRSVRHPHSLAGTADHVVPVEAGGALLDRDNVRAAHRRCNQERHVQWRKYQRDARKGLPELA